MSAPIDVLYTPGAKEIKAYCRALAQELGLTLEDARWLYEVPDQAQAGYRLVVSVTQPFEARPEFWFTHEQVLGYATGETTVAIQSEIRQDLEDRLCEDV